MASPDSLASRAPPGPPALQASAETSLLKCLMATTRKPEAWLCPAPWVPLAPAVSPALLVLLVLKVSKVLPVNLESLVLLVPWVPVVLLAPLARTEMTVKLGSLAAPESAAPPAPRVHVVSQELLVCQA